MIASEERSDVSPICPHCKTEVKKVWYQQIESIFGKRYLYFCPSCRAVLGVTHRKGLLMG